MKTISGWKEIAIHMNQGLRTVQRWEHLGLPVHRVGKGKRAPVVAFAEELDAWERGIPRLVDEIRELKSKVTSLEAEIVSLKGEVTIAKELAIELKRGHTPTRRAFDSLTDVSP